MTPSRLLPIFACALALGALSAPDPARAWGKDKKTVDPSIYRGEEPAAAAAALRELAEVEAEKGSWENIGIGRVHLMAGRAEEARAIFDRYDSEPGDLIRIGRAYLDADDWETARDYFERVVEQAPEDEDWLVEIGSYYNVRGERERAEELFARSFEISAKDFWNLLRASASYEGILVD